MRGLESIDGEIVGFNPVGDTLKRRQTRRRTGPQRHLFHQLFAISRNHRNQRGLVCGESRNVLIQLPQRAVQRINAVVGQDFLDLADLKPMLHFRRVGGNQKPCHIGKCEQRDQRRGLQSFGKFRRSGRRQTPRQIITFQVSQPGLFLEQIADRMGNGKRTAQALQRGGPGCRG